MQATEEQLQLQWEREQVQEETEQLLEDIHGLLKKEKDSVTNRVTESYRISDSGVNMIAIMAVMEAAKCSHRNWSWSVEFDVKESCDLYGEPLWNLEHYRRRYVTCCDSECGSEYGLCISSASGFWNIERVENKVAIELCSKFECEDSDKHELIIKNYPEIQYDLQSTIQRDYIDRIDVWVVPKHETELQQITYLDENYTCTKEALEDIRKRRYKLRRLLPFVLGTEIKSFVTADEKYISQLTVLERFCYSKGYKLFGDKYNIPTGLVE